MSCCSSNCGPNCGPYKCPAPAPPGFMTEPYHIPGYLGFIPSYKFRFGHSFGRLSNEILQDPCVALAPCPLLEPPLRYRCFPCGGGIRESCGIGSAPHCNPCCPWPNPCGNPRYGVVSTRVWY